jgi:hypothetical protein
MAETKQQAAPKKDSGERIINAVFFSYTDVQTDPVTDAKIPVVLTAYRGETVKNLRPEDIARGEKHGAFLGTAPDEDSPSGFSLETRSRQELSSSLGLLEGQEFSEESARLLSNHNEHQIINLIADRPDAAAKVLDAEQEKPPEAQRQTLLAALERIASAA